MNLRQRINHELENFHSGVEYHVISPERFTMALDAYTDRILTEVREALLDLDLVDDIASEMFLHGYDGDLTKSDTVPPIALGVVIGHLFGECTTCAEGEVRQRIHADAITGEGDER